MKTPRLEPFEKVLVVLSLLEGREELPVRYGNSRRERTENFITALAFDGNREQAEAALEDCHQRGLIGLTLK